jgi:hypothetical protein
MDRILLFQSTAQPEVFGFTVDITGDALPREFAPWLKAGSIPIAVEMASRVKEAIDRDGFYLSRNGSAITLNPKPG